MEQALVLISIVLGVAITFELENLNRLIRAPNVRWHWAQMLFAFFALMIVLVFWWMMANNASETITLGEFLPIMGLMVVIVLIAAVALPDKVPTEGTLHLGEYYMANRKYQWGLVLIIVVVIGSGWLATLFTRHGFFEALIRGSGEWVSMLLVVWMMFANRWWKVGVGYLVLSFIPIAWLSRTIG
ncbi:MAG: hypothetical protein WBA68_03555 [Alteraurantiacibacter sp.]